jgi:hypothetical protein
MSGSAGPVHAMSPDALAGLADIAVPEPVSWFPHTWGWWVIAGIVLAAASVLAIRWARRYLANRYRREALGKCAALEASLDHEDARAEALAELAVLLKRTALSAWPRPEVAALSGPAWIAFLRRHGPRAGIDARLERLLHDTEYRPGSLATFSRQDAHACAQAVRHWIETHRVPS